MSISDIQILKSGMGSDEEGKEMPSNFPSLGDTLASAKDLFMDLQEAYLIATKL